MIVMRLEQRGYTVHAPAHGFEYLAWERDPDGDDYGQCDAIREAQIGGYYVAMLLPAQRLVNEINGGIHVRHAERGYRRCAALRAYRLMVVVITEDDATHAAIADALLNPMLG